MEENCWLRVKPIEWFKENLFCGIQNLTEEQKKLLEDFVSVNCSIWPKSHTYSEVYEYCPEYILRKFCERRFSFSKASEHRNYSGFYNFSSCDDINIWLHKSFFYVINPQNTIKDIIEYCKSGYCIRECNGCVLEKYKYKK